MGWNRGKTGIQGGLSKVLGGNHVQQREMDRGEVVL
jgi:hypothetical protein